MGRRRPCFACSKNLHRDCELHLNDGAVDALDFIDVNCNCPCKGRVRTKLIDLVRALDTDNKTMEDQIAELRQGQARVRQADSHLMVLLNDFFTEITDDEGNLLGLSRNRNWQRSVEELRQKYHQFLNEGEEPEEGEDEEDWSAIGHPAETSADEVAPFWSEGGGRSF